MPILVVSDTLKDSQKEYLATLSGNAFRIIGGVEAVNAVVAEEIAQYGAVSRFGGETRLETSVLVAKNFIANPKEAVVAFAYSFPDGLCGGPLALSMGAPLLLVTEEKADIAAAYAAEQGIDVGYVLGGTIVVSDEATRTVYSMDETDTITVLEYK